jgi:hypothetical protein
MRAILSGAGIKLQALEDPFSSRAFDLRPYQVIRDIGAFDDPVFQAKYIKRYVPANWSDANWKEFLSRAWAWLRGR